MRCKMNEWEFVADCLHMKNIVQAVYSIIQAVLLTEMELYFYLDKFMPYSMLSLPRNYGNRPNMFLIYYKISPWQAYSVSTPTNAFKWIWNQNVLRKLRLIRIFRSWSYHHKTSEIFSRKKLWKLKRKKKGI